MTEPADDMIPGPDDEVARLVAEAHACWAADRLFASEAPLNRALELTEARFGPDDPATAAVLADLGWLASRRGEHAAALERYDRALAIREAALGADHPETLRTRLARAAALFEARRHDEADADALRALEGFEATGREDAELAAAVATLGYYRYWVGRYAEAEPLLLRALALRERLLGPGHAETARTAQLLGVMYDHRGFEQDPIPFYRKAAEGFEAAHGADDLAVIEARFRLADRLHRQGRDDEAAPQFERVIAWLKSGVTATAVTPGTVGWLLDGTARFLRDSGREAEADALEAAVAAPSSYLQVFQSDVDRAESGYGPDSLELAEALITLANVLATEARGAEAAAHLRRALAIREAALGADHPLTAEAATALDGIEALAASFTEEACAARLAWSAEVGEFDPLTAPWLDERRPGLIRAYLEALAGTEGDANGAEQSITALSFLADAEVQWPFLLELIAAAPDDPKVLQAIAAGPLEAFLSRFDAEVIGQVEAEAARDPRFHRVLSGVWQLEMSEEVWERVRALQATAPDPLPEMPPFGPYGGAASANGNGSH